MPSRGRRRPAERLLGMSGAESPAYRPGGAYGASIRGGFGGFFVPGGRAGIGRRLWFERDGSGDISERRPRGSRFNEAIDLRALTNAGANQRAAAD